MSAHSNGYVSPHLVPPVCHRIEELQRDHDLPVRCLQHILHGRRCRATGRAKSDYQIRYAELASLADHLQMTPADAFPQVFVRYDEQHVGEVADPEDRVIPRLLVEQVEAMLSSLPDQEERILRLHYLHDFTHKEIAQMEGLPQHRVSRLKQRALRRLRHPGHRRKVKDFLAD